MASSRKYKCPYCDNRYDREKLINHIDKHHQDMVPDDSTPTRVVFNLINKRTTGYCRVCNKETKWREDLGRYDVLCDNPKCKEALRRQYQENMIRTKGTDNILNDPEQQKKMLAARKISGSYKFRDGGVLTYTGSYEKECLEFMDKVLDIPSKDILSPGPTIIYKYKDEDHVYIPDFYLIPQNLIIEVKDGGNNPNTRNSNSDIDSHERTLAKENAIRKTGKYNYIRLTNNQFSQLINVLMEIKKTQFDKINSTIMMVNESKDMSTIDVDFKKKNGKSFKIIDMASNEASKYIDKQWQEDLKERKKHARIAVSTTDDECAGYIYWNKSGNIAPLKVFEKYRGYGVSELLLKEAIDNGGYKLGVYSDNEIAIKLYKKLGFVEVDRKTYKDGDMVIIMELQSKVNESVLESYIEETTVSHPKKLYFVSEDNFDNKTLQPRIPSNYMTKNGYEDGKTARVCFAPSIDKCLMALSQKCTDMELYIHIPDNISKYEVLKPNISEVPDSKITNEYWICSPVKVKCIGKIKVIGDAGEDGIPYKYGDKTAELYKWNWEWVDRFNESYVHEVDNTDPDDRESVFLKTKKILKDNDIPCNVSDESIKKFINYEKDDVGGYSLCIAVGTDNVDKAAELVNPAISACGGKLTPDNYGTVFLSLHESIESEYLENNDSYYNIDNWGKTTNILWVTGLSGSDKTTLAKDLAKVNDCYRVELDYIAAYYMMKTKERGNGMKFYNLVKEECPLAVGFFNLYASDTYGYPIKWGDTKDIINDFLKWFIPLIENQDKLCIINGAQIVEQMDVEYFYDKPIIIKDSSWLKSSFRRASREMDYDGSYINRLLSFINKYKIAFKKSYIDAMKKHNEFDKQMSKHTK